MSDWKLELRFLENGDTELAITDRDLNNVYPGDLEPEGFVWALNGCICGFPICCIVFGWKRKSWKSKRIGIQPLTREEFGLCRKRKHEF